MTAPTSPATATRDLGFLAGGFGLLAVGAAVVCAWAVTDVDVRGSVSTRPVWLSAGAGVPWLLAAAATSLTVRRGAALLPGLGATLVLLVVWVVCCLTAAGSSPGATAFAVPVLLVGAPAALLLVVLVRLARSRPR